MSNFEKITASPEVLGAFLASIPMATGPWDEEFHTRFCAGCAATCDVCPYAAERNDPLWWLMLEEKQSKVESLLKRIMKIYDDYTDAMEEVKRLYAAEQDNGHSGHHQSPHPRSSGGGTKAKDGWVRPCFHRQR